MQTPTPEIDPARCPLCGQDNRCAMEAQRATGTAQPPCWCLSAQFSAELIQSVAPQSAGLACICARCAAAADPHG